jgi:hypothetical protein
MVMVDNGEFIVNKVRELFDETVRLELAEKVMQEVFDVEPLEWDFEKNLRCKRPYVKYVEVFDQPDELIFIGEKDDGKYYVERIEFIVREIDPRKFYYSDWKGFRIFDEYSDEDSSEKLVFEIHKDIEKYGLCWRLTVRTIVDKFDETDEIDEIDEIDEFNDEE